MIISSLLAHLALCASALAKVTTPHASIPSLRFDTFGYVCISALSSNAYVTDNCVLGTEGDEEEIYKEYYTCLCALKPFLISQLNCIVDSVEKTNASTRAIADSWYGNEETCKYYNTEFAYTFEEAWEELQANPVTLSYEEANATVSAPFYPNYSILDDTLLSIGLEYHTQHYDSELFGMITLWYFFGIVFIQGVLRLCQFYCPGLIRVLCNNPVTRQIRRSIVMPATFKRSRAEPIKFLRVILIQYPPRLHVFLFLGYLFLNIFFLCFHYKVVASPYFYATEGIGLSCYVAWRSGQLAMYKMPLVFLLAGRNNILIWITGWQMEVFNHWHRWIARLLLIDAIVHAGAYSYYFKLANEPLSEVYATEAYLRWGAVATVAFSVLCFNGTKTFRQLAYETFLYVHIIVAVFSVVGLYWHIKGLQGFNIMWSVIAFWGFDRAVRLFRILISNPMSKATIVSYPNDILEVTVSYSGLWKPKAGTYVFIHFLTGYYGFQSHPFTIIDGDKKGEFKLYCKVLKGATRNLHTKAQKNGGTMSCRVLVEGPYGVDFATKMYQEVVLFAGGVGITAVYSHLKSIATQNVNDQVIHVHWAISTKDPLEWFQKELQYMHTLPNVNITIYLTGVGATLDFGSSKEFKESNPEKEDESVSSLGLENYTIQITPFSPLVDKVVADHCINSRGAIVFFVCGPNGMVDAVRAAVSNHMLETKNYVEYFEESFSM